MGKRGYHMAQVIDRNIKTLLEVRRQIEKEEGYGDRVAQGITAFCGSMPFVYLHILWFAGWILWNTGMLGVEAIDPFPFGLLTTIVSLEAIFLSMFVLINQNHMSRIADQRANLDLQINLLGEYEITKILRLTDAMADQMGLEAGKDPELEELKEDVSPERVLKEMEKLENGRH